MTMLFNADALLAWLGHGAIVGIFVVLFIETGLLVGAILPGDSLLLTAGLLCAVGTGQDRLCLPWVLAAATAGTLLGSQLGYLLGRRAGGRLRARTGNRHVAEGFDRTERLLVRAGLRRALVLSRFVPVVRTMTGPTAGALGVPVRFFVLWQAIGGLLWTSGLTTAGYAVGAVVPGAEHAVDFGVALCVLFLPLLILARLARTRFTAHPGTRGAVTAPPEHDDRHRAVAVAAVTGARDHMSPGEGSGALPEGIPSPEAGSVPTPASVSSAVGGPPPLRRARMTAHAMETSGTATTAPRSPARMVPAMTHTATTTG
jgi:membrane-associated protein